MENQEKKKFPHLLQAVRHIESIMKSIRQGSNEDFIDL